MDVATTIFKNFIIQTHVLSRSWWKFHPHSCELIHMEEKETLKETTLVNILHNIKFFILGWVCSWNNPTAKQFQTLITVKIAPRCTERARARGWEEQRWSLTYWPGFIRHLRKPNLPTDASWYTDKQKFPSWVHSWLFSSCVGGHEPQELQAPAYWSLRRRHDNPTKLSYN